MNHILPYIVSLQDMETKKEFSRCVSLNVDINSQETRQEEIVVLILLF